MSHTRTLRRAAARATYRRRAAQFGAADAFRARARARAAAEAHVFATGHAVHVRTGPMPDAGPAPFDAECIHVDATGQRCPARWAWGRVEGKEETGPCM